jgi:hypothetical protein
MSLFLGARSVRARSASASVGGGPHFREREAVRPIWGRGRLSQPPRAHLGLGVGRGAESDRPGHPGAQSSARGRLGLEAVVWGQIGGFGAQFPDREGVPLCPSPPPVDRVRGGPGVDSA